MNRVKILSRRLAIAKRGLFILVIFTACYMVYMSAIALRKPGRKLKWLLDLMKNCPNLNMPENITDMQSFQYISPNIESQVFSAFKTSFVFHGRVHYQIRILGYVDTKAPRVILFCQIWTQGGVLKIMKSVRVTMIERHGYRFAGVWYICRMYEDIKIHAVSLVTNSCDNALNLLPVIDTTLPPDGAFERNFTTCVAPFTLKYRKSYELIEKIELDRMFGADLFVFYNYSIGSGTDVILEYYSKKNLVSLIQWPLSPALEIHYYGQVLAINDCVYRYAGRSRYISVTDLDEVIVPLKHGNWSSMLTSLTQNPLEPGNIFVFRCSTFRKEWTSDPGNFSGQSEAVKYKIMSLLKFLREPNPRPLRERPKTMLDPRYVDMMGIHEPHSGNPGAIVVRVPTDTGLLFHYNNLYADQDTNRANDTFMIKYASTIVPRIVSVWKDLEKRIPLPADCDC